MIHIEGMGWLGSALAFRLAAEGIDFTWNDTEETTVAWRASTGSVYPAGDERSLRNLELWRGWVGKGIFPAGTVEEVDFAFQHRSPPHKGRYPMIDLGIARLATPTAVAVDVPMIVQAARSTFAGQRSSPVAGADVVHAHGFTRRRAAYMWGWSAPVRLDVPSDLEQRGRRVAMYSRAHRFQIVYAYAIPSRPGWWWAGSSLIRQTRPVELDAEAHLGRWQQAWRSLWPDVAVVDVESPAQGWRPVGSPDDSGQLEAGLFPPLWHSGVRWAPEVIEQAVEALRCSSST